MDDFKELYIKYEEINIMKDLLIRNSHNSNNDYYYGLLKDKLEEVELFLEMITLKEMFRNFDINKKENSIRNEKQEQDVL